MTALPSITSAPSAAAACAAAAVRGRPAPAGGPLPAAPRRDTVAQLDWPRLALDLNAAALQRPLLQPAAQAAVCLLARRLGARSASLAWLDERGDLLLLACSDGSDAAAPAAPHAAEWHGALLAALGECVDQRTPVSWPPEARRPATSPAASGGPPTISVAHRSWVARQGGGLCTLPLVRDGQAVGALALEWVDAQASSRLDREPLEHLTAWLAALLGLMQSNERPWHRRLRDGAAAWWRSDDRPQQRRWRALWPVAAVLVALPLLWPVGWHVGGAARLEGGVQRVLAAPSDGFIERVHARPGDHVPAGQPLVDLADRELQLERQRWHSQLAQQLEGLATAQARADRAALAQHQARADEAQAQLELAEQKLARSRLVAPFDAVVVQGDLMQQLGAPVREGAELMTLAPAGTYRVIVEVDEVDIARVQPGQGGSLALSALPWQTAELQVRRVSPVARAVEGRNVFEVEAVLVSPPAGARPGLLGQARVEVGTAPLAWQGLTRIAAVLRRGWWRWIG